jgi:hypothetical protein
MSRDATLSCIPGKWSHETGVHIERPLRVRARRNGDFGSLCTHTYTYGVAIYFLTADAERSLDARKIPVDKNHSMCRAGHAADQSLDRVYIRPRAASPRTAADSKKGTHARTPLCCSAAYARPDVVAQSTRRPVLACREMPLTHVILRRLGAGAYIIDRHNSCALLLCLGRS